MSRAIYAPVPANHAAANCLSASTQAGLTVPRPVAGSSNSGTLVLRADGTPATASAMDARLQTGGRPSGWARYSSGVAVGAGALGSAVLWKYSTDSTSQWKGHSDSIYLTSVEFPVTYSANNGPPGTPRTLGNGNLGWVQPTGTNAVRFYTVNAGTNAVTSYAIHSGGSYLTTARSDCVVLPDGSIIAILKRNANGITSFRSSDHGATWTEIGRTTIPDRGIALNAELMGSDIVLVHGHATGAANTAIYLSTDGGATFAWITDTGTGNINPRTCVTGSKILLSSRSAGLLSATPFVPGGDMGTQVVTTAGMAGAVGALVTRDDGTIWAFGWESTAAAALNMEVSVSTDGGATWADPASGGLVLDLETTGYGSTGYDHMSAGCWRGEIIVLARVASASGTDGGIHMMRWGGYGSVTEVRAQAPYEHGYTPVDYPQNVGWTKTDVAAGATLTNQGPLNIVSTAANNSWFRSSANIWTTATDGRKLVRWRLRVNSGGGTADNRSYFRFCMTDGVNQQVLLLRFSTTTCLVIREDTGATIATITDDFTAWADFWLAMTHDSTGNAAYVQLWHRQDADSFTWTDDESSHVVGEVVGTLDCMEFGGSAAGAADWDIAFIQIADSDSGGSTGAGMASQGCTNPDDLVGRPLNAIYPVRIGGNVGLTGGNAGGVIGDTYDLDMAYSHGVSNVWAELRPSRHVRSTADGAAWNAVFDAGTKGLFTGGLIALFGTNVRQLTVEMNASDSWGGPSFSADLDATVWSGAGLDSGNGYVRVTGGNFVPHEFRSDGDGHRWFCQLDISLGAGSVYEISDNDKDTIYIDGIDLAGISGTVYIFGDRMGRVIDAGALPPRYRFARISIGSKETADNDYRVGTLVMAPVNEVDRSYDLGYVDRVTPAVEVTELDSGYRTSSRTGPRRWEIGLQWAPVNGMQFTAARAIQAIYEACDGSHRPMVFWRDPSDLRTLHLVRIQETFTSQGLRGEGSTAVRMVNQLVLSEEL